MILGIGANAFNGPPDEALQCKNDRLAIVESVTREE
jgi:hypothetical protein